jgi:hypothetical protein
MKSIGGSQETNETLDTGNKDREQERHDKDSDKTQHANHYEVGQESDDFHEDVIQVIHL